MRDHPYAPFLHRVNKPARYLGGETGEVQKDWAEVDCRMCLAFPDLYEIGMSHLGTRILYGTLNGHPRLLCERAYAPWEDLEAELRARGEPLRSLESARPLSDFDVVGFSLQYELTYTNVLLMLDLGGIPLRSAQRREEDPLVVCGGPTATHAEPMAPFADVFLIGDGEARTPELLLRWASLKAAGLPRAQRLRELARLDGLYVPALYPTSVDGDTGLTVVDPPEGGAPWPVKRTVVADLSRHPMPTDGPVASIETVFDRVSVEVARGCTEGCRFCQAGMIYRPVRERSPDEIVSTILKTVEHGGYDEASLTSLSTADYSAISPLVRRTFEALSGQRVALSVSSLRAYGLGEDVLDEMKRTKATGLTFAPEAGTQRMRDVINKNITEPQLLQAAERVFTRGWSRMKLYFMIGLPTEEDADVLGIVETGQRTLDVGRRIQKGRAQVTVSVSTHVPKPHTPFQWCAMDTFEEIQRKQELLQTAARSSRVKLRMHASQVSWLEGVLARGDRRLADAVETAYALGARFDSWAERLQPDAWQQAFQRHGIDPGRYLGTLPVDGRLPWDHIDVGLAPGFLAREYRRALKNRLSPPCGKAAGMFVHHDNLRDAEADDRKLVCYHCGVACDLTAMRQERLVFLRSLRAAEPPQRTAEPARVVRPEERRPTHAPQGPTLRVRVGYSKLGRLAFSSHLDLVRLLPRMLRRLKLPVWYTQGFHPKPATSFSPALPLGVASLGEYVDLKLRSDAIDEEELSRLAERMREVALDGLGIIDVVTLERGDAPIGKVVDEAIYVAGVPRATLAELGLSGAADLRDRVAQRVRDGGLVARRTTRQGVRDIDISALLTEAIAGEPGDAEVLARAGIGGELVPMRFALSISQQGTARPSEAVDALLGMTDAHARVVREGVYALRAGRRVDPLDLPGLRAPAPARPATSIEAAAQPS